MNILEDRKIKLFLLGTILSFSKCFVPHPVYFNNTLLFCNFIVNYIIIITFEAKRWINISRLVRVDSSLVSPLIPTILYTLYKLFKSLLSI